MVYSKVKAHHLLHHPFQTRAGSILCAAPSTTRNPHIWPSQHSVEPLVQQKKARMNNRRMICKNGAMRSLISLWIPLTSHELSICMPLCCMIVLIITIHYTHGLSESSLKKKQRKIEKLAERNINNVDDNDNDVPDDEEP